MRIKENIGRSQKVRFNDMMKWAMCYSEIEYFDIYFFTKSMWGSYAHRSAINAVFEAMKNNSI